MEKHKKRLAMLKMIVNEVSLLSRCKIEGVLPHHASK